MTPITGANPNGLIDRRSFDDALSRYLDTSGSSKTPFALVFVDIDHLDAYSKTYGSRAGYKCIEQVNQCIVSVVRGRSDYITSYSRGRSAIILADIKKDNAFAVIQRVVEAVRMLSLDHSASECGFITISAGIAALEPDEKLLSLSDLIATAELALSIAKEQGRNQVVAIRHVVSQN